MKISILSAALIANAFFLTNLSLAAEQKILFNVESVSYRHDTGAAGCHNLCAKVNDPPLDQMQADGWRIISASPKETVVENYSSHYFSTMNDTIAVGCTCKGTQYVLQRDDPAPLATPDTLSKNEELLKKENELLKRENALLKQEAVNLKVQLNQKRKNKNQ